MVKWSGAWSVEYRMKSVELSGVEWSVEHRHSLEVSTHKAL